MEPKGRANESIDIARQNVPPHAYAGGSSIATGPSAGGMCLQRRWPRCVSSSWTMS